jgi:hypothetical protein
MANIMEIDVSIPINQSDAMAWRELMSATDADERDAIFRAWENWRERESRNGRPHRTVSDVNRND